MLFLMSHLPNGRCLCTAVKIGDEATKAGEVVMIGTGPTDDEAKADCRRRLIEDGWPADEATPGPVVWEATRQ